MAKKIDKKKSKKTKRKTTRRKQLFQGFRVGQVAGLVVYVAERDFVPSVFEDEVDCGLFDPVSGRYFMLNREERVGLVALIRSLDDLAENRK